MGSPALAGTRWRLDQGVSATTAQRQLAALSRLGKLHDSRCRGEAAVRAILLGSPQAERLAARPTTWAESSEWRSAAAEQLRRQQQQQLNESQVRAVAASLTRTFTLWQGPPGTGKTRTLLAFVEVMVRAVEGSVVRRHAQGAILAVADTNAAADNLLDGLLARGIRAVRSARLACQLEGVTQTLAVAVLHPPGPATPLAAPRRCGWGNQPRCDLSCATPAWKRWCKALQVGSARRGCGQAQTFSCSRCSRRGGHSRSTRRTILSRHSSVSCPPPR